MWYQGGVIVCVFSLPLTPPKEMFASQNVEKTSTKTESELCTIEILCHESPHCKIHPWEVILVCLYLAGSIF